MGSLTVEVLAMTGEIAVKMEAVTALSSVNDVCGVDQFSRCKVLGLIMFLIALLYF